MIDRFKLEALAEATAVDMVLVAAEAEARLGLAGTSFPSQCPGRHQALSCQWIRRVCLA